MAFTFVKNEKRIIVNVLQLGNLQSTYRVNCPDLLWLPLTSQPFFNML
jgi:hypothetical protein